MSMIPGLNAQIPGAKSGIIVYGIPDFGVGDKLKEALNSFFADKIQALSNMVHSWYTWGIRTELRAISEYGLPPVAIFKEGPISVLLGGTYGLAFRIIQMLIVVAAVVTLIAVMRRKETFIFARVISSGFGLLFFGVLFYPVYSLFDRALRVGIIAMLDASAQTSGSTTLLDAYVSISLPTNLGVAFLAGIVGAMICCVVIVELVAMTLWVIMLVLFFPLSYAFRSVEKVGLIQFQLNVAGLCAIPVSLFFMAVWMCLGLLAIGAAGDLFPGLGTFASLIINIVVGIAVIATPYYFVVTFFNKVQEVIGSTDAKIQSGIDVLTMPTVSTREVRDEASRARYTHIRQFAGEIPHIAASSEDPMADVKRLMKTSVLAASQAAPDPRIRAVGKAAYLINQGLQARRARRGDDT